MLLNLVKYKLMVLHGIVWVNNPPFLTPLCQRGDLKGYSIEKSEEPKKLFYIKK